MARVTVEDCIEKVPNRFSLVLLSAHRARAISAGSQIMVDRDNDKNPVVALREIADDVVDAEDKKTARLNLMAHLLSLVPYQPITHDEIVLPPLQHRAYVRPPLDSQTFVPDRYEVG